MSQNAHLNLPVGEVRPTQLIFTYGVGALVDLPKLSVIVMGLDEWKLDPRYVHEIAEERLLTYIRKNRLPNVQHLYMPPIAPEIEGYINPMEAGTRAGVPVATFPRWMYCPSCHRLAPLASGLFDLKKDYSRKEGNGYRHTSCLQAKRPPDVVPARFLAACEDGHLDDFPWVEYVHQMDVCDSPELELHEYGPSGEARDLEVKCTKCGKSRRLAEAFGYENRDKLPLCRGRRPHLHDFEKQGCERRIRPIILGASNTWFSATLNTISIPVEGSQLQKQIHALWSELSNITVLPIISYLRSQGKLGKLTDYTDALIWEGIQLYRKNLEGNGQDAESEDDLKTPEWRIFTQPNSDVVTDDFLMRRGIVPSAYSDWIDNLLLVERLREVRAMVGFSRIDAPGELSDPDLGLDTVNYAPLVKEPETMTWVPASEVRGEGIFIQFNEEKIRAWESSAEIQAREAAFRQAHTKWRMARFIEPPEDNFPGMRYILIHSFAHALLRQLVLESGYSTASIRERIYAKSADGKKQAMAGLLIYTSAPDSEGTLGGLVRLGQEDMFGHYLAQALESAKLCANDPLCAEREPSQNGHTLHAAACHSCLFVPETSCERGNKYLDRSLLVETIGKRGVSLFDKQK